MNKEQVDAIIDTVRLSWIERHRPESESTDWGQSLAMYGLLLTLPNNPDDYTIIDDQIYEYLKRWVYFHLNESVSVNYFCGSWSIGLLYPHITEVFPEVQIQLRDTAEKIYDFIIHKALRNGDGVLLHNVDLPNIYIDTVYYGPLVLAKLGEYLGRPWKQEAIVQIQKHLEILKNGTTPFYIHCEVNLSSERSEGSWARGNGWVMMTCAELLTMVARDSDESRAIFKIFQPLSKALASLQTPLGLWRTILDDPSSYEETSASAMFLYSLCTVNKLQLLDAHFEMTMRNGFAALISSVDDKGRVIMVSEGTWPGTIEYYKSLECGEWWWGTGAF